MKYSEEYGLEAPELGWVPSPERILLRSALLDVIGSMKRGSFLELGDGGAPFALDLVRHGFTGLVLEPSPEARAIAQAALAGFDGVSLTDSLPPASAGRFDYVFALGDPALCGNEAGLRSLGGHLSQGGKLVVASGRRAIPGPDEPQPARRAGRNGRTGRGKRRDGRRELMGRLRMAGFRVRSVHSYGFPLGRLASALGSTILARRLRGLDAPDERTIEDLRRELILRAYPFYANLPGRLIFSLFLYAQGLFLHRDLGSGYIVVADPVS
jgi:SAM-dependent methyltransferase